MTERFKYRVAYRLTHNHFPDRTLVGSDIVEEINEHMAEGAVIFRLLDNYSIPHEDIAVADMLEEGSNLLSDQATLCYSLIDIENLGQVS